MDRDGRTMNIGVAKERAAGEARIALGPDSIAKLVKGGAAVLVERGAGTAAGFPDAVLEKAGATLIDDAAALYAKSAIVLRVQPPTLDEAKLLSEGSVLISSIPAATSGDLLEALAARKVTALALEKVPRITRAQSMDMLSSQSTVSGYKAVLLGAAALPKFLPSLTTAAGSIPPARVFVLGAGVAGLQAIATARRLGAIVSAFDVRAAAAEQVMSLGATFVASDLVAADAETKGGYARAQGEEERERTLAAIARHIVTQDLVITTALIPGRAAPVLITTAMVASMLPGSVIVDLAAEAGGNCELTKPNETIRVGDVTIIGAVNLPSTVPFHASQMLSRNILTLLQHLIKENTLTIDLTDEITKAMVESMLPGSVIVDLAAEAGGNCELTKPNETIRVGGVTIIGAVNLPSTVPFHASQMLSRNILTLLQHLIKENTLTIDLTDEITKAMVVTHDGAVV